MGDSIHILNLILEASFFVKIIMGILAFLSLLCWVLIFRFMGKISGSKNRDSDFEAWFWSGENLNKIFNAVQADDDRNGLEQIFFIGYSDFVQSQKKQLPAPTIIESVERKLRIALSKQQNALESGLTTLASIGSVSPYIGLLGTVWGIMNAFMGLSQSDQASLAGVAPGIAEALIATAMGLFAAIPAVLAYNHFTAKSATIYDERALFCDEIIGMLQKAVSQTSTHNQ